MAKVRQAERLLERNPVAEKPFEPWELRLGLHAGKRVARMVARLQGAVVSRGSFALGPVDLDLEPGERLAVTGRNGTGKSTLPAALQGTLPLEQGTREVGRQTVIGKIAQERLEHGDTLLLDAFGATTGLVTVDARTLLAKFGLGADQVGRPWSTLSPGERTRARLAELQARSVNLPAPRRADEPSRSRGRGAARGGAALVRRHPGRRLARPTLSRSDRTDAGVTDVGRCVPLHSAAADGSPQAKNLEGPSRQAACPAWYRSTERQRVSELRLADTCASRLPDLQDVSGPRDSAARNTRPVDA